MSERAKVFQNGGSQAVRLPKQFRFHDEEVNVRKVGKQVILEPIDEWSDAFLACIGAWKDEIPRPPSQPITRKRNPFDAR